MNLKNFQGQSLLLHWKLPLNVFWSNFDTNVKLQYVFLTYILRLCDLC